MRDALKDCPMTFNGRSIIPCAVVAGGKSGGVCKDNFNDVLIEFERYLDSDEYNVDSDGVRHVSNKDWKPSAPVYTFTDWHDSRRCSKVLNECQKRGHHIMGWIPNTTPWTQPADAQGFDKVKKEVPNLRVAGNLVEQRDRYTTARLWVEAIHGKWYCFLPSPHTIAPPTSFMHMMSTCMPYKHTHV